MLERCATCGYAVEDYDSELARQWMQRAVPVRARLSLGGLAEDARSSSPVAEAAAVLAALDISSADLHDVAHASHELAARSAALVVGHRVGSLPAGSVARVNTSGGGVPKLPVEQAVVGMRGIVGDLHREPKHHGFAWQGLSLWSVEVIAALAAEGHPIAEGLAGENLSLMGIPWDEVRPGLRLRIGEVLAEITVPAVPCSKNAPWFIGGRFDRMSHDRHPGWSRWYAAVREPGVVRPGDRVEVLVAVASS